MNKEEKKQYNKKYYATHKSILDAKSIAHPKRKLWDSNYKSRLKLAVLRHYSGVESYDVFSNPKCVDCGISDIRVLTIDHIKGREPNDTKRGRKLYAYLRDNGYPKGYQTLCMNCQWIKRFYIANEHGGPKQKF